MRLMFWTHPSPPPATLRCHSSMALQFNHCKQTDGRCCCCCYDNLSNNLGVKSPFCSAEIVPCFIWKGFGVNGVTVQVVAEMRFRSLAAVDVPLSKTGAVRSDVSPCMPACVIFFFFCECVREVQQKCVSVNDLSYATHQIWSNLSLWQRHSASFRTFVPLVTLQGC